jgi:hypothetical protein
MQIAEVELLGVPGPDIIWVSGFYDDNADGAPDDQEWVDLLEAAGYKVDYTPGWEELDDAKIAALNAADLIIVSRNSNSGDFNNGDEVAQWNAVTTPIILSSTHIVRSSRWKWVDSTSILNLAPAVMDLADGSQISAMDEAVGPSSFIDAVIGNGTVLATGDGLPWIFEFEAGVEYYDGAGEIAGGPRVFFTAGTQETAPEIGRGEMNLTAEGLALFMDTVDRLISPPAPAVNLLTNGGFEDGVMDPWSTYGDFVTTAEVVQVLDGAAIPEDPIEGSSCLHVVVADAGANFWDAGLQNAGHVFEAGKAYTLSVYMKSKAGTLDINIKPERGADPWEGYGDQVVTITEEWAEYSVTTPVIDADVDPASITFHIAFTAGDFWVDGASWTVVE